jgi:hypothetical protein
MKCVVLHMCFGMPPGRLSAGNVATVIAHRKGYSLGSSYLPQLELRKNKG